MPRVKAGEMSLNEIRNIARQHNKVSTIKGIDTLSRKALIDEIERMGYNIDHENKKIVKNKMNRRVNKEISVSEKGERKPQKRTKKKMLKEGGEKPPMVKKVPKGFHRMPDGSIMADKDMPKKKKGKAKHPPIKPALEKQKKKKEEKEKKRKALISGSSYGK